MNNETKKVLLFTYYWPPSGGAGVQRWLKFCKYFPEFGVKPTVVTVREDKASYPVIDRTLFEEISPELEIIKTNSFEPLGFYQKLSGRKQIPFAGFANDDDNWKHEISRFIRGNFFIPDARRGWNKYAFEAGSKVIAQQNIKTIITTSPPHSTQLVGLKLKKKYNVNWIADLRDPWTDIYYYPKMNHTALAKTIDLRYEREVLKNADKIIVVSDFIKNMFLQKSTHIHPEKVYVIPNGYDEEDFNRINIKHNPSSFIIGYNGTLADNYPIDTFTDAIKRVIQKYSNRLRVLVRFTGSISNDMQKKIHHAISGHCEFNAHVPHKKSVELLLESNVLLLLIPEVKNNEGILTGKLFEYMAACNPIVCIGPKHGNAAAIINDCEAGKVFEKNESELIVTYLESLVEQYLNQKSIKTKNDLHQKYSRRNLSKQMASLVY